ncbi:hypothetical protein O181_129999 [Austropuccinia psidii MF-1]|uniref:Uncharacterized protein n=1 Tax=Austropuccinia psidii MF-1 TaxID=1389203 RepID=A0A9Q3Q9M4_9BASI|nr:hypothetical protein [Austropuccinia psidii MF-1]
MQIKVEQVRLFSIPLTWYGFLPRISNQPDPRKKLSKRWLGPFPILKKVSSHAFISMEIHPPSLPYLPSGTSQDISNPKSASRASSSNYHGIRRGMGSLSSTVFKAQEEKAMVSGGMERFQSRPRKIHLGTTQKPQELS